MYKLIALITLMILIFSSLNAIDEKDSYLVVIGYDGEVSILKWTTGQREVIGAIPLIDSLYSLPCYRDPGKLYLRFERSFRGGNKGNFTIPRYIIDLSLDTLSVRGDTCTVYIFPWTEPPQYYVADMPTKIVRGRDWIMTRDDIGMGFQVNETFYFWNNGNICKRVNGVSSIIFQYKDSPVLETRHISGYFLFPWGFSHPMVDRQGRYAFAYEQGKTRNGTLIHSMLALFNEKFSYKRRLTRKDVLNNRNDYYWESNGYSLDVSYHGKYLLRLHRFYGQQKYFYVFDYATNEVLFEIDGVRDVYWLH